MNPYEILGVRKDASAEEIKKAYRKLAQETHPDRNPDDKDSEERFKKISSAYDILSNPEKKRQYDNPSFFNGPWGFSFESFIRRPPAPPVPRHGTLRGNDINLGINVNPFQLILGELLTIKYKRPTRCNICDGHGADIEHCPACEGYGFIREVKEAGFQRMVNDYACDSCLSTGIKKTNVCNNCKGSGLIISDTEVSFNLNQGNHKEIIIPEYGGHGPMQGPPGNLVISLQLVFPSADQINDKAKEHIRKAIEHIYNKR